MFEKFVLKKKWLGYGWNREMKEFVSESTNEAHEIISKEFVIYEKY